MKDLWDGLNFWAKTGVVFVVLFVSFWIGLGMFKVLFVTDVDNYQVAFRYDLIGQHRGEIVVQENSDGTYRRGWIVTLPIVHKVHTMDLRPMQLQMNANSRVLNAKLVQFDPKGLELFLSWHGRNDYEGPGTGSAVGSTTPFSEILRSYAYDGNTYPFLKILRELGTTEGSKPLDGNAQEVHVEKATPPQTEK